MKPEFSLENKHFLVSGGAGFIGGHLCDYLLEHKAGKVVVIDNFATGFKSNLTKAMQDDRFQLIEADICDSDNCIKAMEGIDYVLHQAAIGSVPRSLKTPLHTAQNNIMGTLNIFEAARLTGVKRVVYASSSSVYGDDETLPKQEGKTGKPLSPYAATKATTEVFADVFHKSYGLEVIGLRYFNVFGPRQTPDGPYAAVIPLFIDALLKNESPIIFGDGEQSRDFTFVDNVIQANIKALYAPENAVNQVFNIACGERYTVNEIFHTLADMLSFEGKPVYKMTRKGDIPHSHANITKATNLLNYHPQIKFKEGLQKTLNYFSNTLQSLET